MSVQAFRSPRYPRLSLSEALEYAQRLYSGAHKNAVDAESAYKIMGFAGKNGSSATAVGALRQFGLVSSVRGEIQITDLTLRILEPSSLDERNDGMRHAATMPEAFNAIQSQFSGSIPRSDEPIRSFLIRVLNFSKSGADDCVSSLRKTMSELERIGHLEQNTASVTNLIELPHIGETGRVGELVRAETSLQSISESQTVRFILSKETSVELKFVGPINSRILEKLCKHIELMDDNWSD